MTWRIRLSSISPDLRFALAGGIACSEAFPGLGGASVAVTSCVPEPPAAPAYLRYADRDAELIVLRHGEPIDLDQELANVTHELGESGELDDLGRAVVLLDAVDSCFRECGLWGGNIYLAGASALNAALQVAGVDVSGCRDPVIIVRELAALELAYLFPVAGKFRSGWYDGQVQYRLNGWGRALAGQLAVGRTAERASEFRELIGGHLAAERGRYACFLQRLYVIRPDYASDLLEDAMQLPIPVLA